MIDPNSSARSLVIALLEQSQRRVALRLDSTQTFTIVGWTDPGESGRVISAPQSKQFIAVPRLRVC